MTKPEILITDRDVRESCLGTVRLLKVFAPGYPNLTWHEVWEAFTEAYPGQWAVQVFPPQEQLVDSKAVYHLFVLDQEPVGLNLR